MVVLLTALMANLAAAQVTQSAPSQSDNAANMTGAEMGDVADLIERTSSGEAVQFATASARSQVNMAAQNLNAQLSQGKLNASLSADETVRPLDARLASILMTPKPQPTSEAVQGLARQLVEQGLPVGLAQGLVESISGLTTGGKVEAGQFVEAVRVYNNVVSEAPATFLKADSQEFNAVRAVLTTILDAAAAK